MFEDIIGALQKTLVDHDRWLMYLEGLGITLILAVGAMIIGMLLGTGVAIVKVNHALKKKHSIPFRIINAICNVYITVIRGTPVVVQLMIFVFAIFSSLAIELWIYVAMLAFGINSGAYVAEIVRAGIMAVNKGQFEAGRSLGLSNGTTMKTIILPQAIKNILPALGNELIVLFKETSIVSLVAIVDITAVARLISSRTYDQFTPLLVTAALYLIVVMIMTFGLRKLERRLAKSDSR